MQKDEPQKEFPLAAGLNPAMVNGMLGMPMDFSQMMMANGMPMNPMAAFPNIMSSSFHPPVGHPAY
jgi:hypothetical protein